MNDQHNGHTSGPDPEALREAKEVQRELEGEFPNGRLNAEDSGALSVAIGVVDGDNGQRVVQFVFPYGIKWFAVPPDYAIELAEAIVRRARQAGATRPFTLQIGG